MIFGNVVPARLHPRTHPGGAHTDDVTQALSPPPPLSLSLSADPADMEGGEERGRETESRRMEWMNESGGREGRRGQTTSFLPQREREERREREQERGNPISDPSAPRPRRMLSLPLSYLQLPLSLSFSISCIIHRMRRRPCVLSRICSDHVTAPTSYVRFSPSKRISHVPVCLQRCSHSKNRVKLAIVDVLLE